MEYDLGNLELLTTHKGFNGLTKEVGNLEVIRMMDKRYDHKYDVLRRWMK